ncbi:MAG TPA: hypothetical protein PKI01_03040 [Bacteroidales bacterium]|nr:hypothetical protein [Bacteroidales bacterium]
MKTKIIKISLLLITLVVLCVSCNTSNNCMRYHNDDVKRGLAH